MSYTKHNFKVGDVLAAAQLNEMDDQIATNETAAAEKYAKPTGGIPASDLAPGVLSVMSGASDSAAGTAGMVPAPAAGSQGQYLRSDGTWSDDLPTRLSAVEALWNQSARLALTTLFAHVAFTDTQGPALIAALETLLGVNGGETPGTMYTITKALTNSTLSNDAVIIAEGTSYSAVISPTAGYDWPTVRVSMGGTDITATAYNAATGAVSITNVTGNIIITASAEAVTGLVSRYGRTDTELTLLMATACVYADNGSGTQIGTSKAQGTRQVVGTSGADEEPFAVQSGSTYYPIPVPVGATAVSVYTDFDGSLGVMGWIFSDGVGYLRGLDTGWQTTVRSQALPSGTTHISIACNNNDAAVENLLCLFE